MVGSVADIAGLRARDDLSVVFVLIDTLRAEHLGCYGYDRATSPNLDAIASQGIRFSNVLAQSSWTKSSMASLWTGTYPVANGVLRYSDGLSESVRMPAEILRDSGFATVGIFRNGWVAENFGFAQGFDLYVTSSPGPGPKRVRRLNPSPSPLRGTDYDVTEAALEFLRTRPRDRRFLMYLHYMDVHQYLYEEQSALFGTTYRDAYDNAIHWVDRNLGALVSELEALDLMGQVLLVIAADHGEAFGEHGREGHARDLHAEVTRTPLVISLPWRLAEPLVVDAPVRNVDLWPTLLDMLGRAPLPDADGRSLVPLITGESSGSSGTQPLAFSQLDRSWGRPSRPSRPIVAVADDTFRLLYDPVARTTRTYRWRNDPLEQVDVTAEVPDAADRLRARADQYLDRRPSDEAVRKVELDELKLGQLRALGYAIEDEPPSPKEVREPKESL